MDGSTSDSVSHTHFGQAVRHSISSQSVGRNLDAAILLREGNSNSFKDLEPSGV
jgi:hypothetical protein